MKPTQKEKLIGAKLAEIRLGKISQRELAKKIRMSTATISRIESGQQGFSIGQALKISEALDFDLLLWIKQGLK